MDNKTFINKLAKRLNREPAEIATLADGMYKVLIETGNDLDSVAIPGFGTFKTIKHDEEIINDDTTGRRTILPPAIVMEFQPSIVLRKKLAK